MRESRDSEISGWVVWILAFAGMTVKGRGRVKGREKIEADSTICFYLYILEIMHSGCYRSAHVKNLIDFHSDYRSAR